MDNQKTLRDLIQERLIQYGDIPVFSFFNSDRSEVLKIMPDKFARDVEKLGAWLLNNGYYQKHIAILSENSYEYLLFATAIACSGNVAVLLDTNLLHDEYEHLLDFNDCSLMCVSDNYQNAANNIKQDLVKLNMSSTYELINDDEHDIDLTKYNELKINVDDNAIIIFTSGTSGERKGVLLSHLNITSLADGVEKETDIRDDVVLSLPLYHVFGFVVTIACIQIGLDIFINQSLRNLVKDILAINPSHFCTVPAMLPIMHQCLSKLEIKNRVIVCGGAAGAEKWIEPLKQLDVNVILGYGMTETSSVISLEPYYKKEHDGFMKVIDTVSARIDDPDTDGIGEILVKGATVMKGYYKMSAETNKVIEDGWLHTGDLGKIDERNYLTIVGRKKNILVLPNGENIAPEMIEKKILKIEGVKECVVSINEGLLQANIYAPDGNVEQIKQDLKSVNNTLNSHMRIAKIEFREEEFAKNSTGKIIRQNKD